MPTSPVPFVHPSLITVYSTDGAKQKQLCIYNPFPHDVTFKLDNPSPSLFTLSQTQGYIKSSNKLYVELTCTTLATSFDGVLQVRFFKCSRLRHGHKPHTQQYVGFREVRLKILTDPSERGKCAEEELVSLPARGHNKPPVGSNFESDSNRSSGVSTEHHCFGRRAQVITCLVLAVVLLVLGFTTSQTSEAWFAANIGGLTTSTCAVVCYTLSCVLLIRLLTLR
ncbi:hypothetical protein BsWGS_03724 [Bradybaena similaris]